MRIELKPVANACGACSLCCKVLHVAELAKPQNVWCPQARKGRGCAIYTDPARPAICADFSCLWQLQGMAAELRPDRIHGVLVPATDRQNLTLHEDPGYPEQARRALKPLIEAWTADGTRYVVVVCGPRRTFFGNPALFAAVQHEHDCEDADCRCFYCQASRAQAR